MAEFFAMRKGDALYPHTIESAAVMAKIPFGKIIKVATKAPRNGKFNALFWVLCTRIGEAVGADPEAISDHLKVQTGHAYKLKTKRGIVEYPKSISYASMDNVSFGEFFEKCVRIISEEWSVSRADVLAIVSDLLEPKGMVVR